MRPRSIPPNLESAVLAKAGEGLTLRAISTWLERTHKVRVGFATVGVFLRKQRDERAVITKAVVREKLSTEVVTDIDILAREQRRIERLSRRLHIRANAAFDVIDRAAAGQEVEPERLKIALMSRDTLVDLALKASDRVDKLANRKLHYAGADGDDGDAHELAEAGERVRSRLAHLADSAAKRGGAP